MASRGVFNNLLKELLLKIIMKLLNEWTVFILLEKS